MRHGGDDHLDTEGLQTTRHRPCQLRIPSGQDLVRRFDDGHFRPKLGESHAKLQPDIACSDHGQAFRNTGQGQRIRGGQDAVAKR